jgi:hypothetical protein
MRRLSADAAIATLLAALVVASSATGAGYPRPRGATSISTSLVIAYRDCIAPNRVHRQPISYPSCSQPVRSSPDLTAGSPETFSTAQFEGRFRMGVITGLPGPPDDSDVAVSVTLVDVRCEDGSASPACTIVNEDPGADYVGEMEARVGVRITDRASGDGTAGTQPATAQDATLAFPVLCHGANGGVTSFTGWIGAHCSADTSLNALFPHAIRDGRRAIFALGRVEIWDGGYDGVMSTQDNHIYATQGIFTG